jgi:serine/threonine-protein kinase
VVPKIADFGLAKCLGEVTRLTQTGQVVGTPSYMAPEQAAADRQRIGPWTDVYALGAILYECLTGQPPFSGTSAWATLVEVVHGELVPPRQLRRVVPAALETICLRALAREPARRFASAAELAADLRRFLDGTSIRARRDGWLRRQGRQLRRHARALSVVLMLLLVGGISAGFVWLQNDRLVREATTALNDGTERVRQGDFAEAARTLGRGLEQARAADAGELAGALEGRLTQARRGLAVQELHRLAEHIRFHVEVDAIPAKQRQLLETQCRRIWDSRDLMLADQDRPLDRAVERDVPTDLLDLALFWAELKGRGDEPSDESCRQALAVLTEAESRLGSSPVLARQRQTYATALGQTAVAEAAARRARELSPRTPWEHYALGRQLLREARYDEAVGAFERAVATQPQGFWPHFYFGICAQRRHRPAEAVEALGICIALAPKAAPCYYQRAQALSALGRSDRALLDYDRVLQLEPSLAAAWFNRGLLHAQRGDHDRAIADLQRALEHGGEPGLAYYNLAVVHEAHGDRQTALDCIRLAERHQPQHRETVALRQRLERIVEK